MDFGSRPVCQAIVEAIADAEGVDPLDLPVPLATVVDPDALEAVLRGGNLQLAFEYDGYRVSIDEDRTVEVTPATEA